MDVTMNTFGEKNFAGVDLRDKRRTKRLVKLVDIMCRKPGGTLPDKFNHPADLHAFYRLMNCEDVTHEVLMAAHRARTRQRIAELGKGPVLILHDATELDFTSKTTLCDDLGQIGRGTRRGYICHNSLAVEADTGWTLGLTSQILHHRADVPKQESKKQHREREDRESRLWPLGVKASGAAPEGVLCVDVSDALSDTFEYMSSEVTQGRHFVLRSRENRCLVERLENESLLYEGTRALPSQGERKVRVQASLKRKAREATLQVSFSAVRIAPPGKRAGEYEEKPLDLWVVRTWEEKTSAEEESLEWILLSNVPITDLPSALERIRWYEQRSIIEEYHKGMKTGCGIEKMQFTEIERLEPAIAVLSAVTTTLLCLRDAAHMDDADERPATDIVDAEYVEVLGDHYGSRVGPSPSVKKFFLHVARLGGHQNRKRDGLPGWITLWRGWMKLQAMVDGHRAAFRKFEAKQNLA